MTCCCLSVISQIKLSLIHISIKTCELFLLYCYFSNKTFFDSYFYKKLNKPTCSQAETLYCNILFAGNHWKIDFIFCIFVFFFSDVFCICCFLFLVLRKAFIVNMALTCVVAFVCSSDGLRSATHCSVQSLLCNC